MTVRLFDAWIPEDPALVNSHQVAQWTEEALGSDASTLTSADVTRAAVEADFAAEYEGFAFFGHGSETALWGVSAPREAVVDDQNLAWVGTRWIHAFACLSGKGLALTAPREGVDVYAGYNVKVLVEFTVSTLPPEVEALLKELVTVTTMSLRGGARSQRAIAKQVRGVSRRIKSWLDKNQKRCLRTMDRSEWIGLQLLATLLHDTLELHGTAVTR